MKTATPADVGRLLDNLEAMLPSVATPGDHDPFYTVMVRPGVKTEVRVFRLNPSLFPSQRSHSASVEVHSIRSQGDRTIQVLTCSRPTLFEALQTTIAYLLLGQETEWDD